MKKRKLKVSYLVIISFIASLLLSLGFYQSAIRSQVDEVFYEEAYKSNDEIAESAVDFLNAKLNQEISSIIGVEVAHHNIIGSESLFDDDYYQTILDQSDYINRIEILSTDYEVLYSSDSRSNRVGIDLSNDSLFLRITEIHQLEIGELTYNQQTESLALEVVYSGEDVVVYALISVDFFKIYGDSFKESFSDKELMVLSGKGQYLFDSKADQHLYQAFNYEMDDLVSAADASKIIDIDDEEVIVTYRELEYNDWKLIVYESTSSALNTNRVVRNYTLLASGIIFMISMGLSGTVFYFMHKSLRSIVHQIEFVTEGDFDKELVHTNIKEVDFLVDGFALMKEKIKENTKRLEHMAYHDELTGLGNRYLGEAEFKRIDLSRGVIFYYIDINRFDVINENYGYDFGDQVLRTVSAMLSNYFQYVYRMQSDEFLCLANAATKSTSLMHLEEMNKKLNNGIMVDNLMISLNIQIGSSQYPKHSESFLELAQLSRIALNELKINSTRNYLSYSDIIQNDYMRLSKIELMIKKALLEKEFTTVYQPIIDMKTMKIRGFEALSRWNNKELGFVTPDEFIPVLERLHLVHLLDELVINRSVQLAKFIHDETGEMIICSINMSVETIMKDNFVHMIDDILEKYDYDAQYLELEITESTIVKDFKVLQKKMSYLRSKGVKFSEDDFGDEYSSLTYLTRLDIDTLKISRNFLSSILNNVESRVLVQAIVDLSHKLGFYTIVEGIEDKKTFELFKEYDCDFCQGYYFSKPIEDGDFVDLIKEKKVE